MPFSALMAEFVNGSRSGGGGSGCAGGGVASGRGGWVHGVAFSPSGDHLAWVAHDSSVNVARAEDHGKGIQVRTLTMPLGSLLACCPG